MNQDELFVQQFLSGKISCELFLQEYQGQPGLRKCLDDFYTDGIKRGTSEILNPPLDTPEKYMSWIGKCAFFNTNRYNISAFAYANCKGNKLC